jgi:dTDP-glucose 4,6-dehydratase
MPENRLASDLDHVLEHTRELWEELRGERIFITGGTGFFGCWLLESFAWANDRLDLKASALVLTRNLELEAFRKKIPHLAENPTLRWLIEDMGSFLFPKGIFSHIIHAATEPFSPLNTFAYSNQFDANIQGTRRVLEFAHICGARKLLFTSSGAVYGKQPPEISHIPEEYVGAPETTDPSTAYGQSKRASEFLCAADRSSDLQAKIVRCFAFVGPYLPLDANYAVGNFIRDGLKGGPILVHGDGTPRRSYLYAADLVIWLWTILFRGQSCRPYNVGSDEDLSIIELAQRVKEVVDPEIRVDVAEKSITGKPVERYVPSVERCKSELGLQVRIPLLEAIRRTAGWNTPSIHKEQKGA